MKHMLIPLAIGLGLASSTAFAAEIGRGSINFYGQINSGSCPIEIIDPSTGLPVARINMGNVNAAQFNNVGVEAAQRTFGMRLTPGGNCSISAGQSAIVTFTGAYGGAGAGNTLYALQPGSATNLALVIKDSNNKPISNGGQSRAFPLDDTKPTTIIFSAAYQSIGAPVSAGSADTDVSFIVDVQ
ncbi:fimbrial protein [Pseudomonas alabamensis]|uniref:fimbrial protein n=1 Tax=Pseudomonas alabamensis TaxID=3064349 RepID=UPI000745DA95|nr:type 1 pili subunit FimI [Pseudomonas monteilii]